MIEPAVVAAAAVVAGAVLSVSARDGRVVAIGMLVAMVAAPLVASPLPETVSVAARIVGAVLASYLLWTSARERRQWGAGSTRGLAAEAAVAAAAFAVGLSVSPVSPLPGPQVAQAAGLALVALAVVPLLGRDVMRLGVGVVLLILGSTLLTAAWLGSTPPLAHFAVASLLTGAAGVASLAVARLPLAVPASAAVATKPPTADTPRDASSALRSRARRLRSRSDDTSEQPSVWSLSEQDGPAGAADKTPTALGDGSRAPAVDPAPAASARPARLRQPTGPSEP
jgi:hypothetical protein